jgi:hypothetical protein
MFKNVLVENGGAHKNSSYLWHCAPPFLIP